MPCKNCATLELQNISLQLSLRDCQDGSLEGRVQQERAEKLLSQVELAKKLAEVVRFELQHDYYNHEIMQALRGFEGSL
jgi:hypothetical protein